MHVLLVSLDHLYYRLGRRRVIRLAGRADTRIDRLVVGTPSTPSCFGSVYHGRRTRLVGLLAASHVPFHPDTRTRALA